MSERTLVDYVGRGKTMTTEMQGMAEWMQVDQQFRDCMVKLAELHNAPLCFTLVWLPADTVATPAFVTNMSVPDQIGVLEAHIENLRHKVPTA